ncbi:MAG: helix-turn-helix domain-containing protein [Actinomycetaceae bacterium]|nr:helix-turn-helix domain-containing protein [Actinomycetaceae bacterium]
MANPAGERPQFYTVAEVADLIRVSRMTVYRMVHAGELPAIRVGGSYRVPASALESLVSYQDSSIQELRRA